VAPGGSASRRKFEVKVRAPEFGTSPMPKKLRASSPDDGSSLSDGENTPS
jgi:hypothetical protein